MFGFSAGLQPPEMHAGPDLAHIQSMLSDSSPSSTQGSKLDTTKAPRERQQAREQAKSNRPRKHRGGHARLAGEAGPSSLVDDPAHGSGGSESKARGAGGADLASRDEPHNKPGPRSDGRRWHCKACDCFVGDGQWEGHIQGMRHRRHSLSLREFGEPGRMVVSTFEAPSAWEAKKQKREEAPAALDGPDADLNALLTKIQSTALKELVNHTGVTGGQFQRLGEQFSTDRLRSAWLRLAAASGGSRLQEVAGNKRTGEGELSLMVDGALLACLAWGLANGGRGVCKLWVTVTHPYAEEVIAAGLVLLARSLPQSNVSDLGICIVHLPLGSATGRSNISSLNLFHTLLRKLCQAILASMERCSALRFLEYASPSEPSFHIDIFDFGELKRTIYRAKTMLLMAQHPRMAGRCPLLGAIPLDCLRTIFGKAFPSRGLEVLCRPAEGREFPVDWFMD